MYNAIEGNKTASENQLSAVREEYVNGAQEGTFDAWFGAFENALTADVKMISGGSAF
jgi:hypothetical protein